MEIIDAVSGLSALAHEGRLTAFRLLVQAGPTGIAAGAIARQMQVPANTLSANLAVLSHAGLIDSRREGRSMIYTARYQTMTDLLDYLIQDCCGGAPAICAALGAVAARSRCDAPAGTTQPIRADQTATITPGDPS